MFSAVAGHIAAVAQNVVAAMIIAVSGGGLCAWYAAATQHSVALAVAEGAVVMAAMLAAWNYAQQIADRQARLRLETWTAEDTGRSIRDWLYKAQYAIRETPVPHNHFTLTATDGKGLGVSVSQQGDSPWVTIMATTGVVNDEKVKSLVVGSGSPFLAAVCVELIQLGVEYKADENSGEITVRQLTIVGPETTALSFLREVFLVTRGLRLISAALQQAVREGL